MIVVVVALTLLVAAAIYALVIGLASVDRRASFSAVSPGLRPPMSLVFGLLVGFLAAQVWSDSANAQVAANREASSLRSVELLSVEFPREQTELQALIRRQIEIAVTREWPAISRRSQTLSVVPQPLARALKVALTLPARTSGQVVAQREIVTSLENALDARRWRIIVSISSVNWAKWTAVIALGALTLLAIAFVHGANRLAAAIAMTLFAGAIAVSVLTIALQDRPFAGPFRVKPTALVHIEPQIKRG